MEYLRGRALEGLVALQVPSDHVPKVAKQLAVVMFQIHELAFDRLGRLWCGDDGEQNLEVVAVNFGEATPLSSAPRTSLE